MDGGKVNIFRLPTIDYHWLSFGLLGVNGKIERGHPRF
jgi:hypothetical protein